MHQVKASVQDAHQQASERQLTEPDATGEPAGHGPWTAGAPPCVPVSRVEDPGAVSPWLLGQRPGEAGMQADIDEPATRPQDPTSLYGKGREVVHGGLGPSLTLLVSG
jgi:hypothetical protein